MTFKIDQKLIFLMIYKSMCYSLQQSPSKLIFIKLYLKYICSRYFANPS